MADLDPWYLENLVCPVDRQRLRHEGSFLVSTSGRNYPIVDGMPVMLLPEMAPTMDAARISANAAPDIAGGKPDGMRAPYIETLGISPDEKELVRRLYESGGSYDAVVSAIVAATCGLAYRHLIGAAGGSYPIPSFRFPARPGKLLDVGCNWGRWTIAAAKAGHDATGIDPQLGAVMAARRVAAQLGVPAHFVVADGRYLPFPDGAFDGIWSYSVLQHFSKQDARAVLDEIARVARPGATIRIQMANLLGLRSFIHAARRRFRAPGGFEVRYWRPSELEKTFTASLGATRLEADCFLGLGLQWSDFRWMSPLGKCVLVISETLRRLSGAVRPLTWFADSLFCTSIRKT